MYLTRVKQALILDEYISQKHSRCTNYSFDFSKQTYQHFETHCHEWLNLKSSTLLCIDVNIPRYLCLVCFCPEAKLFSCSVLSAHRSTRGVRELK